MTSSNRNSRRTSSLGIGPDRSIMILPDRRSSVYTLTGSSSTPSLTSSSSGQVSLPTLEASRWYLWRHRVDWSFLIIHKSLGHQVVIVVSSQLDQHQLNLQQDWVKLMIQNFLQDIQTTPYHKPISNELYVNQSRRYTKFVMATMKMTLKIKLSNLFYLGVGVFGVPRK